LNLLAFDTSGEACSVAVRCGDKLFTEHVVAPRAHSKILLPMIERLLATAGISLNDVDAIVPGDGPGSFIGLRIAASVAQGLAFSTGIELRPVSSMMAIAIEVLADEQVDAVLVAQDARMNEVYVAEFQRDGPLPPRQIGGDNIQAIGQLEFESASPVAAGGAWQRHASLCADNEQRIASITSIVEPKAECLLVAAESIAAVAPESLTPRYVRSTVAHVPAR